LGLSPIAAADRPPSKVRNNQAPGLEHFRPALLFFPAVSVNADGDSESSLDFVDHFPDLEESDLKTLPFAFALPALDDLPLGLVAIAK
jgi:hypothetical protein